MKANRDKNIKRLKKEIELKQKIYNQIKYETELIKEGLLNQGINFNKMLKEYNKYKKNSIAKDKLINEYKITQDFIKENDQTEKISDINSFTNSNITEKDLIQAQINNKENYQKINKNIDNSCQKFMNSKLTTNEFRSLITTLGTDIKNKIIYETYHHPEDFIPLKEIENSTEDSPFFIKGILSKFLIKNNITVAIKKQNENEKKKETL